MPGNGDGSFASNGAGLVVRQTCVVDQYGQNVCSGPSVGYPAYLKQLDINGDALPDVISSYVKCDPTRRGCVQIQGTDSIINRGVGQIATTSPRGTTYSTGSKFEKIPNSVILGSMPYTPDFQIKGDFNGDHMEDFAYILNTELYVFYSKGDGSFDKVISAFANGTNFGTFGLSPTVASNSWQVVPGDFNGDGRTDFVVVGGSNYYLFTAKGPIPDVITNITDGLSVQVKLSYSTPSQSMGTNYKSASGLVWPKSSVTPPQSIVISADMSDGAGGWREMKYSYGGALMELGQKGRGYMGFSWMQTKDVKAGLTSRAYRRQDWPYVGLPDWSGSSTSEFNWDNLSAKTDLIKQTTNHYACTASNSSGSAACSASANVAGSRYIIFADQIRERLWDYSGTPTASGSFMALPGSSTTQSQDAWGNPTSIKREVLNADGSTSGFSTTVTNTYSPADTSKWQLGRLLRSSVQSSAP